MEPYLYLEGLRCLAGELSGDEVVHVGIRPYGFHAGNALAIFAYPYLLCELLEQRGGVPRFRFVVSLNDWEPDQLDGPDYRAHPYNIHPTRTSIQFMPDEFGCCSSVTDHWEPVIRGALGELVRRHANVRIEYHRNSALKQNSAWKERLLETIRHPGGLIDVFRPFTNKVILDHPVAFAGVACPECRTTRGETVFQDEIVTWHCLGCGIRRDGAYENFDYWWYHKPMLLARMEIFQFDITISGGDHFSEGDFQIRRSLIDRYAPGTKIPKMLFAPTLLALDGEKMSKSRHNTVEANLEALVRAAEACNGPVLQATDDILCRV